MRSSFEIDILTIEIVVSAKDLSGVVWPFCGAS